MHKPTSALPVGEKNRAIILQAAEHIFAQHGFKGAAVQQIADKAGLPKTNVLYYFKSKKALYLAILNRTLSLWNSRFDQATATDDPAVTLAEYISEKMAMSRTHPRLSRIFAMEIINGAPNLDDYFTQEHVSWMAGRVAIIEAWIADGKMQPTDPHYLLYTIWASTQHYADFATQILRLRGTAMNAAEFEQATRNLIQLVLTGCGLSVPAKYQ